MSDWGFQAMSMPPYQPPGAPWRAVPSQTEPTRTRKRKLPGDPDTAVPPFRGGPAVPPVQRVPTPLPVSPRTGEPTETPPRRLSDYRVDRSSRFPEYHADRDEDGDQIMASRPTVPPSAGPVFPLPGYEDSQWGPFENFADLERFIDNNMELTQFFVAHPRDPMTEDWLAQVRGVVPDSLPGIMEHRSKSAMLWQVIGRALNLSADNCGGVLAELYWVRKYDPEVIAQRNDLTRLLTGPDLKAYAEKLAFLTKRQRLPVSANGKIASISFGSHGTKQGAAKKWLEEWIKGRQKGLLTEHGSAEKWLRELGEDTTLGYDRALDRLADVITSFDGHRVCVAVLHNEREIGICANHPDNVNIHVVRWV
ncbi:hypothetical protein GCM10009555_073410 [Acrocarpospora macrocephala]